MHAWILSKLLSSAEANGEALQRYIIASCLPKIHSRLTHKILSKPFIDSLKMINMETVKIVHDPQPPNSSEAVADRAFLCEMLHPFVKTACVKTPIPNLLEQATAAIAGQPHRIYTDDTCSEFHELLLELLHLFEENLANLLVCRQQQSSTESLASLEPHMKRVYIFGHALACISRGSAINTHLKTIESSLLDRRRHADVKPMKVSKQDDDVPEFDSLHAEVQPYALVVGQEVVPLWMSYRDWLRLMVVHFEAVTIVAGHVTRPAPKPITEISIQILSSPRPGGAMLSWRELLASQHFPGRAVDSETDKYSAQEIATFLDEYSNLNKPVTKSSLTAEMVIQAIATLDLNNPAELANSVALIGKQLQSLSGCKSPGSTIHINDIILTLNSIRPEEPSDSQRLINDAIRMVQSLMDSSNLFRALRKEPLNLGKNFKGHQHCEASLAAAITAAMDLNPGDDNNAFRDLVSQFQVRFFKL
jgi:hypothetical protein